MAIPARDDSTPVVRPPLSARMLPETADQQPGESAPPLGRDRVVQRRAEGAAHHSREDGRQAQDRRCDQGEPQRGTSQTKHDQGQTPKDRTAGQAVGGLGKQATQERHRWCWRPGSCRRRIVSPDVPAKRREDAPSRPRPRRWSKNRPSGSSNTNSRASSSGNTQPNSPTGRQRSPFHQKISTSSRRPTGLNLANGSPSSAHSREYPSFRFRQTTSHSSSARICSIRSRN